MALTEINSLGIKDAEVKTADLAADAVTGAKIADDAIDSEHYTDGSIDAAHLASNAVTTAKINADAVTGAKIADDAIDSEHYTDGSIDTAHIAADAVTGAKIADDAVGAEHIEQLDNNLQFADSCHAKFGTDNDLAVYHDGTNANIINTTGNLYIEDSSGDVIIRAKGSENSIYCHDDGSVDLYYDNEAKIVTKANGATVQDLTASGAYLNGELPSKDELVNNAIVLSTIGSLEGIGRSGKNYISKENLKMFNDSAKLNKMTFKERLNELLKDKQSFKELYSINKKKFAADRKANKEEAQFIKETYINNHKCREITLIPQKQIEEITTELDITQFESVDEIVAKEITAIDSDNFNKKMLLDIYNEL